MTLGGGGHAPGILSGGAELLEVSGQAAAQRHTSPAGGGGEQRSASLQSQED